MRILFGLSLAVISGILFAMAFPDSGIAWLAFVALTPLLLAIAGAQSVREAFFLGWASQTVAWLLMVPWVVRVMSHYGGLPYATGVAIFVAMALLLGLYGGLFAIVVRAIRLDASFGSWLLIPLAWAGVELARTHLLTGFPWNLLAAAIVDYTPLIQISRFAGPYFVGALIVLPSAVLGWVITQRATSIARVFVVGLCAILMFVWWTTGYVAAGWRGKNQARVATAALLQPNISQEMRWNEENLLAIFRQMMDLTVAAAEREVDVIVWPESTVPLSFSSSDFYRSAIESLSGDETLDVILGSVAEDSANRGKLWNAAFLVSNGKTIGHYDKIRLVPFGEYVPLRKMLFFAEKLVHAVGEFEFGTNDKPLAGKYAYGPAICYEIVFPSIAVQQVRNGAQVLVTITNDAWYDGTSAPRQHLNQARLRAVETDRWLLRSATTGISALVDPTGRIIEEIPMGRAGVIYGSFAPMKTMTPYVRLGDWFAWGAALVVIIAIGARRRAGGNE